MTEKDKRRIELLRYRIALLNIRKEKYVIGCSRYCFAAKRIENSAANLAILRAQT